VGVGDSGDGWRDEAVPSAARGGDEGGADDSAGPAWRIDDLARLSGTTVDTVRFYQREGLLPPATRRGRSLVYGPAHLERLERIRDLQARHFTLKGIRALAEEGRLQMLDRLFASEKRTFTREQLVAESGLEPEVAEELARAGVPGPPEAHGALAYDGDDLAVLSALRASMRRGMPVAIVTYLARLYERHMEALRQELYDAFAIDGAGPPAALADEDIDAFRTLAGNDIDAFLDDSCVLLEYLHRRGVQRMVLEAMRLADAVGGSSRRAGSLPSPAQERSASPGSAGA
jgi:DNA-binding transcriptional MerR regulator